jgi:hypothetical protein
LPARDCSVLPLSPCGRGWLREAETGEGLPRRGDVLDQTPHPTEIVSTGGDALSHRGRGQCDGRRDVLRTSSWLTLPLFPCGRGWLRQRVGAKRRPMINSAETGEGFYQQRVVGDQTPHPTEFVSAGCDALSHRGRGRCDGHRDAMNSAHSAASAMAPSRARSTTASVVRMRWVVPSWKRITVSIGMSRLPP